MWAPATDQRKPGRAINERCIDGLDIGYPIGNHVHGFRTPKRDASLLRNASDCIALEADSLLSKPLEHRLREELDCRVVTAIEFYQRDEMCWIEGCAVMCRKGFFKAPDSSVHVSADVLLAMTASWARRPQFQNRAYA